MIRKDRLPAIFLIAFSAYVCFESLRLGFGSWRKPGPGFLSFWSGAVLGSLALASLLDVRKIEGNESKGRASWKGAVFCFLALVAYTLLLNPLGFIPTTFLFVTFIVRMVEGKSWVAAILLALGAALGSHILFDISLKSQLPRGIMEILGL